MTSDSTLTPDFRGWRACDGCGEVITSPSDAVLTVAPEYLRDRQAGIDERVRAQAAGETPPHVSTGLVPWDWVHRMCMQPREVQYVVEGHRFDTLPKALARTLELMDRKWFMDTAWEDAIRRFYEIPTE